MLQILKKALAFVLAFAMLISAMPLAMAAQTNKMNEEDAGTLTLKASIIDTEKSDSEQTVTVYLYMDKNAQVGDLGVDYAVEQSDAPVTLGTGVAGEGLSGGTTAQGMTVNNAAGAYMTYDATNDGYILCSVPVTIEANAAGTYNVKFSIRALGDSDNGDGYTLASKTVTATISITEPVDEDAFTVYYQIEDTIVDADNDNVHEVDLNTNFNVGVYVKAGAEQVMQAFDIYPEWHENLEFVSVAGVDGVTTIVDKMEDANPHFQTQFADTLVSTNVAIKTTGTKIATLTMKLKDSAVYDNHYPIWIEDATNLAKENDPESVKKVTVTEQDDFNVETLKTYTVTYDANGGSFEGEAPTQKKQHNVELTLDPDQTPSRDGYTFLGWSTTSGDNNAAGMITSYTANEATTLYAVWKANTHTVTGKNFDGSDYQTTNVTHGEKPSDPGAPDAYTKEGYTVTFAGWATSANQTSGTEVKDLPAVTTDGVVYYAAFKETVNQYTITFDTDGGSEINPIKQDYGTAVQAPADPEKEGYTFAGWDKEIPATMPAENVTITAKWTINQYTITFNTDGGSEVAPITQDYNTPVTAPAAPEKEGYTFAGWDKEIPATMPAGDVTITAKWTINQYTITFDTDGGSHVDPITQDYNTAVTKPADPTREGYTFAGWSPAVPTNMPAENITVTAQWTQNEWKVSSAEGMTNGSAEATNDDGQSGSSANAGNLMHLTVTPATGYELVDSQVTFTYKDKDGNVIKDENGNTKTYTVTLTKGENVYTYDFTMPDSHVIVSAEFDKINYTVTVDSVTNGTVTLGDDKTKITAHYQEIITVNVTPAAGYELETLKYTVDGEEKTITATDGAYTFEMPAGNVTVSATFKKKQITLTLESDGKTYTTVTGEYESEVPNIEEPTKEGYTFTGWSPELPNKMPAENATYTAQWSINSYEVKFLDDVDGTELKKENVQYGATIEKPADPTKTGYTFAGWSPEVPATMPAAAQTFIAQWTAKKVTITLDAGAGKFTDVEGTPSTQSIERDFGTAYGELAEPKRDGYEFAGWQDGSTIITAETVVDKEGPVTLTAKWTANEYTVTFDPANGGEVSTLRFKTDTGFTTPAAPEYAYHTFKGWKVTSTNGNWPVDHVYNAGTAVKDNYGDVTLTAQWEGSLKHVVEDYKYAPANYVMLRIETTEENTSGYKFGDIEMYYTADTDYLLNGTPVLVTLIPMNNGKTGNELVTYVSGNQLTDAGLAMLNPTTTGADSYDRTSGLINKDEVVNIADANAVYQMVIDEGSYYSLDQLSILKRLMADMDTGDAAAKRGTIADVNAIVTIINNAANAN